MKDQAEKLREILKENETTDVTKSNADIITITSGKGGVGKTNVAVNLALNLIKKGKKVLVIDADLGLANVEILMGTIPKYNFLALMNDGREIAEIISDGPEGLKFISGGSGIGELANLSEEKLRIFAKELIKLDQMFDIIIIDTGAGISDSVMAFLQVATKVLLVTTGDPTSITDAYALLKVFKNAMGENKPDIKVIVNMVTSREKAEGTFLKLNQVCEKFLNMNIEVIEYLPNDVSLGKAVMMQKPVSILFPKSDIGLAFSRLANKVDEEIAYSKIEKLEDLKNSIEEKMQRDSKRGLFSLIHHMLRKKEDL